MDVYDFPSDAFLPASGFRQKLAELFNARAYRPEDVRAIRTSVYYSDFEVSDHALRYCVTTGHALRQSDDRFMVYTSKSRITEDPIRRKIGVEAGFQDVPGAILCPENEVIQHLKALDARLREKSDYALAFPKGSILYLRGDLHLDAAIVIFHNGVCHRDEIIAQQKSARYYHDRPVMKR